MFLKQIKCQARVRERETLLKSINERTRSTAVDSESLEAGGEGLHYETATALVVPGAISDDRKSIVPGGVNFPRPRTGEGIPRQWWWPRRRSEPARAL